MVGLSSVFLAACIILTEIDFPLDPNFIPQAVRASMDVRIEWCQAEWQVQLGKGHVQVTRQLKLLDSPLGSPRVDMYPIDAHDFKETSSKMPVGDLN